MKNVVPMTTARSRRLYVSSSLIDPMTMRSALPGLSPLSVRKRAITAPSSSSATPTFATRPGRATSRSSAASRHTMAANAAPVAQSGTRSTCSRTAPASSALIHATGELRMRSDFPLAIVRRPVCTVRGECREALMPVLRPAVRLQLVRRNDEPIPLAVGFRIHDPAGKLLKTRLHAEMLQSTEVEYAQLGTHRAVFLHEQRSAARVGLPRHLPRRGAVEKRPQ